MKEEEKEPREREKGTAKRGKEGTEEETEDIKETTGGEEEKEEGNPNCWTNITGPRGILGREPTAIISLPREPQLVW